MMKKLLVLLILCVTLVVLRVAALVLAVALALMLIGSFIARPKETLTFLGTLSLSALAMAQPLACIIALGVIGVVIVLTGRKRNRPSARYLVAPPP